MSRQEIKKYKSLSLPFILFNILYKDSSIVYHNQLNVKFVLVTFTFKSFYYIFLHIKGIVLRSFFVTLYQDKKIINLSLMVIRKKHLMKCFLFSNYYNRLIRSKTLFSTNESKENFIFFCCNCLIVCFDVLMLYCVIITIELLCSPTLPKINVLIKVTNTYNSVMLKI